ncbi:MAG: hypothetical protein HY525_07505 [Betaproteobacteria bacterium]|nr:hypothetical protein [Betaproteobacteria bacterium]
MIYMVDHIYTDPSTEAEWHDWYAGHLPKLLSVPGLSTVQRFKAIGVTPSRFLAMYTLESAAVYDSPAYKGIGGGGSASARFHGKYQIWTRNLFDGAVCAPKVADAEFVFVFDSDAPDHNLTSAFNNLLWLKSVGLHMTTKYRALAVLDEEGAERARNIGSGFIYAPLIPQLTSH